jgi:hypothetical protein
MLTEGLFVHVGLVLFFVGFEVSVHVFAHSGLGD